VTLDTTIRDAFDTKEKGGQLADLAINSYKVFNSTGLLDMVSFVFMLAVVVILGIGIYRRLTKDVQ
jgi:hypothetical protein